MEALARSIELGAGSGDEITSKEEPGTAEQSLEENISSPEFSPHWGFYLAFASLCVVTLAVCILRLSPVSGSSTLRSSYTLLKKMISLSQSRITDSNDSGSPWCNFFIGRPAHHSREAQRNGHWSILVWYIFPLDFDSLSGIRLLWFALIGILTNFNLSPATPLSHIFLGGSLWSSWLWLSSPLVQSLRRYPITSLSCLLGEAYKVLGLEVWFHWPRLS